MTDPNSPVRLAVVGGRRGRFVQGFCAQVPEKAVLSAVCDQDRTVLAAWRRHNPEIHTFESYDALLEWGAFDAVVIATPITEHARQSIQALAAGKHVLSEVVAATTLDESWELVEAVEKSGMTYMMSENYCYQRLNMMIRHMVDRGVFGELTYAEGAYIHDTRDLVFRPDGSLTWRGALSRDYNRNRYPTHSLGPVSQWLGVNREGGDRLASTVTYVNDPFSLHRWVAETGRRDHPAADPGFFKQGDTAITLIRTEKGRLIVIRVDSVSWRPHNMTHYHLQGTNASYISPRFDGDDPLIWIRERSPGYGTPKEGQPARWESAWEYADEYEHPRWKARGELARGAGHGGGDFFVIEDFVDALRSNGAPPIDVYDAVTWSSIIPLSQLSVERGGATVEIPDFRRRRRLGVDA